MLFAAAGMVGDDRIDMAAFYPFPQKLAMFACADRRIDLSLEADSAAVEFFVIESEVMQRCF